MHRTIEPLPSGLLADLQDLFNEALNDDANLASGRFHFDYVDSDVENALAFRHAGVQFVGITVPLVVHLWNTSSQLTESSLIATTLGLPTGPNRFLHSALFRQQLGFIVNHEYAHHFHGDTPTNLTDVVFSDETTVGHGGGLAHQVREADADARAADLALRFVLLGNERSHVLSILELTHETDEKQDQVLMSCLIAAVGSFFVLRPLPTVDAVSVYGLTHPPPPARIDLVIHHLHSWYGSIRPEADSRRTGARFDEVMEAVVRTVWDAERNRSWSEQVELLRTQAGRAYISRLVSALSERNLARIRSQRTS